METMTMELTCDYLGLRLPHPFIAGACPLADSVESARRVEDAGAAAIVMRSLFEEQLRAESMVTFGATDLHAESFGEATSYLPSPDEFVLGPDEYLEHLGKMKRAVTIPVIASLNGTTLGGWLGHARAIQQAGADALELNLYSVATDPARSAAQIEDEFVEMVRELRTATDLPLAIKLSPFYTSLPHFAARLVESGAHGLVLFNRFFEPEIDTQELEVRPMLTLSTSSEVLLRLRWLAILSGQLECSLAITGGVHSVQDAVKAIMCGADCVQLVSTLLKEGLHVIEDLREGLAAFLVEREYDSLSQMKGSMNLSRCPDPKAFERANYMQALQTWEWD